VTENRWVARPATASCSDIIFEGKECYGSMLHLNAMEVVRQLNQRDRFLAAAVADDARIKELEAQLSDDGQGAQVRK
jgi:hypothetical protein